MHLIAQKKGRHCLRRLAQLYASSLQQLRQRKPLLQAVLVQGQARAQVVLALGTLLNQAVLGLSSIRHQGLQAWDLRGLRLVPHMVAAVVEATGPQLLGMQTSGRMQMVGKGLRMALQAGQSPQA